MRMGRRRHSKSSGRTFLTVGEYPTWTWNDVSIYGGVTSLSTADLDGNGLDDIVVTGNDRIHAYYSLGDGNWQMDIIANELISPSSSGFINEDGTKTTFQDPERYISYCR